MPRHKHTGAQLLTELNHSVHTTVIVIIFPQPLCEPTTGTADWDWFMEEGLPLLNRRTSISSDSGFLYQNLFEQ